MADVLEAIKKNNPNLLKVKLSRKDFDINETVCIDDSKTKENNAKGAKTDTKKKTTKSKPRPTVTPLVAAAENKNIAVLELLIKLKADVNKPIVGGKRNGQTPLIAAVKAGWIEAIKVLVEKTANVNYKMETGYTALHAAIEIENHEIVKYLIEQKADVNTVPVDKEIGTPLYHTSEHNKKTECATELLQNGAKADLTKDKMLTPLYNCIKKGFTSMIDLLMKNKASLVHNEKPIVIAAIESQKAASLKKVLEFDVDVNATYENKTPLLYGIEKSCMFYTMNVKKGKETIEISMLDILLGHKDIELEPKPTNVKHDDNDDDDDDDDDDVISPLMMAAQKNSTEVTKVLLKKGVNINLKDNMGNTAFHYLFFGQSASTSLLKIFHLFVEHGGDPAQQNDDGFSPYQYMLKKLATGTCYCAEDIVNAFLKTNKFQTDTTDANGDTALLTVAGGRSAYGCMKALIEYGCNVNAQNKEGMTALHYVCLTGYDNDRKKSPTKLLLDNGALVQPNNRGEYPFFLFNRSSYAIDILIESGKCNFDLQANNGDTMLHHMIRHSSNSYYVIQNARKIRKTVSLNVLLRNNAGKTAAEMAWDKNWFATREILQWVQEQRCKEDPALAKAKKAADLKAKKAREAEAKAKAANTKKEKPLHLQNKRAQAEYYANVQKERKERDKKNAEEMNEQIKQLQDEYKKTGKKSTQSNSNSQKVSESNSQKVSESNSQNKKEDKKVKETKDTASDKKSKKNVIIDEKSKSKESVLQPPTSLTDNPAQHHAASRGGSRATGSRVVGEALERSSRASPNSRQVVASRDGSKAINVEEKEKVHAQHEKVQEKKKEEKAPTHAPTAKEAKPVAKESTPVAKESTPVKDKVDEEKVIKPSKSQSKEDNIKLNQALLERQQEEISDDSSDEEEEDDVYRDVMISYQWESQPLAKRLREYLIENGNLTVWMDITDMRGDMNEAMAKGVAFSEIFLMCVSKKYKKSPNCKKEYDYAAVQRKEIIPVKVQRAYQPKKGTALDLLMGSKIYYDIADDFETQSKQLLAAVKEHLGKSS